jgi:predicted ATP-dependent endonuclease of OLD family
MHIKFVEIQNFRKLKSCRIDFSEKETVFVGANNSGKTSAMDALGSFLKDRKLTLTDFTLSNWWGINKIGETWCKLKVREQPDLSMINWESFLPALDVWIQVDENEIHYVSHLIPTLDWNYGLLGVRLRFEPKDVEELYKEFKKTHDDARETTKKAAESNGKKVTLNLWPDSMRHFLEDKLNSHFGVFTYILNPDKCKEPEEGVASPQPLPSESERLEGNPFDGLIKIDEITAQRGFSDPNTSDNKGPKNNSGNLTAQFKEYFSKHLNPSNQPDPADVDALQAIDEAKSIFDNNLKMSFSSALKELEDLGYPGFSNPKITLSSKIEPMKGLDHDSAVQFDVIKNEDSESTSPLRLPEKYNGLGYQNLISMVFKLIRFRDEWMRVGKVGKINSQPDDKDYIEPLHLVLIEEPEAHLHAQVQQVFINKAYGVLRNNNNLKDNKNLSTQLVVSTHSSHIAHEINFTSLRYFRRRPADKCGEVPTATIVNLSKTFGEEDETTGFAIRYLKTTHCDLFFADAAILVEGPAERMLVPLFIRNHFPELTCCYISLLEIGGSHAHRLKPLLEDLGLISLIITDIDSVDPSSNNSSVCPAKDKNFITGNTTLKQWLPKIDTINGLLNAKDENKISSSSKIRVAYQIPISIKIVNTDESALPYTFEDSLVFQNIQIFKDLKGTGLIKKFKTAIESNTNAVGLGTALFNALNAKNVKKAEFALDVLFSKESETLNPPNYIKEGLDWLQDKLSKCQIDLSAKDKKCNEDKIDV